MKKKHTLNYIEEEIVKTTECTFFFFFVGWFFFSSSCSQKQWCLCSYYGIIGLGDCLWMNLQSGAAAKECERDRERAATTTWTITMAEFKASTCYTMHLHSAHIFRFEWKQFYMLHKFKTITMLFGRHSLIFIHIFAIINGTSFVKKKKQQQQQWLKID